jgi:hypothetical protein
MKLFGVDKGALFHYMMFAKSLIVGEKASLERCGGIFH